MPSTVTTSQNPVTPAEPQALDCGDDHGDIEYDGPYIALENNEPNVPDESESNQRRLGQSETDTNKTLPNPSTPSGNQVSEHGGGSSVSITASLKSPNGFDRGESDAFTNVADNQHPSMADGSSRSRRIRKARVINLKACMCGFDVSEDEIQAGDRVVQCKVQGCETQWVCRTMPSF